MGRLTPLKSTLRNLAVRSKNQCAFPGCDHPILNLRDEYVAELCHIEAAEPGGPRYNPDQTDEDRRAHGNLLFLCHAHHVETDDADRFPVAKLQQMKSEHESLPEVVFDHAVLLERVEHVLETQKEIMKMLGAAEEGALPASFPLNLSWLHDSWTPERGRFYELPFGDGRVKLLMQDGWLHIEQAFDDGAVAYYEVNEEGSVRASQLPYPVNEYHVEIPAALVLRREAVPSSLGDRAIRTVLKWSAGTVTEHFVGDTFVGADCKARCRVENKDRVIRVLMPGGE